MDDTTGSILFGVEFIEIWVSQVARVGGAKPNAGIKASPDQSLALSTCSITSASEFQLAQPVPHLSEPHPISAIPP